jgi:hypothetical protein
MINNNFEQLKLIKDHLCDDLDAQACKELIEILKTNKEVRIYFDTVKKTVALCRNNDCPKDLPEDINQRLFKALGLENTTKQSEKGI